MHVTHTMEHTLQTKISQPYPLKTQQYKAFLLMCTTQGRLSCWYSELTSTESNPLANLVPHLEELDMLACWGA